MRDSASLRTTFLTTVATSTFVLIAITAWRLWPAWVAYREESLIVRKLETAPFDRGSWDYFLAVEEAQSLKDGVRVLEALARELNSTDEDHRVRAAVALGRIGRTKATVQPELLDALPDLDRDVRITVTNAFREIGQPAVEPLLRTLMTSTDPVRRYRAAEVLGNIGSDAAIAVPALIERTEDEDAEVREWALFALNWIGQPAVPIAETALKRLRDESAAVRNEAVKCLRRVGMRVPSEVIGVVAEDASPDVRRGLLESLFRCNASPAIIDVLTRALDDPDTGCRRAAADALGELGQMARSAVPKLESLLESEDAPLRLFAAKAICRISQDTKRAIEVLLAEIKNAESDSRLIAMRIVGALGSAAADTLPALQETIMAEPRGSIFAKSAINIMGQRLDHPELVIPFYRELLRCDDPGIRVQALQALAEFGPRARQAQEAVQRLLEDSESQVRSAAQQAINALEFELPPARTLR